LKHKLVLGTILFVLSMVLLSSPNVYADISPQQYFLTGATNGSGACAGYSGAWGTLVASGTSQSMTGANLQSYLCYATAGTTTPSSLVDNGKWTFHADWTGNSYAYTSSDTFTFSFYLSTTQNPTTLGTPYGSGSGTFATSSGNQNVTIPVTGVLTSSGYYVILVITDQGNSLGSSITFTSSTYLVSPPTMTVSYAISGTGTGYTAPSFTFTRGGATGQTLTLTTSPQTVAVDPGTSWSVTNPLSGSNSSVRWVSSPSGGTFPSSCPYASSCVTQVFTYQLQ